MTSAGAEELSVLRADAVAPEGARHRWLVDSLWSHQAVGVIGGPPKACKSWLGLDLAVSVASATRCLDRFEVEAPGPSLVYLAEDALPMVRRRIEGLCEHRGLSLRGLELYLVDTPSLRLDQAEDRRKLQATLSRLRPALLVLDPLVRLHRMDENSSGDVSRLLGYLRELQRRFELAVTVVHHMAKRHRGRPGQSLRGSGDIHAWSDSSAYLVPRKEQLRLVIEHRCAPCPTPLCLKLVGSSSGLGAHLEVSSESGEVDVASVPLTESVLAALSESRRPMTRLELRSLLRVNNKRLGDALLSLEERSLVTRTRSGWSLPSLSRSSSTPTPRTQLPLV